MSERGNARLRALDKYLGIPLTFPAALYRSLFKKKSPPTGSQPHICIFCPGAIGDLLLLSALVNGIHHKFPGARIELVTSKANVGAICLLKHIDAAFSFSIKKPHKILRHLRSRQYDILFDSSQWSRLGNILCNLSRARVTVGFDTPGQHRKAGYSVKVAHCGNAHEVQNFISLGRALWPDFNGSPALRLPDGSAPEISENAFFCHMWPAPGKGSHLKQWPASHWAELINFLLSKGFRVYLTGSANDAERTSGFIEKYFGQCGGAFSLAGEASIPELAHLLLQARGLVSVNTGIMHLGALLGTPTIGLHGATNPLRWGPIGPACVSLLPRSGDFAYLNLGFEYPPGAKNSMGNLPVADVLDALRSLKVQGL